MPWNYKVKPDDIAELLRMRDAGKTLREIADRFGVSRERVRQILAKRGLRTRQPIGRPRKRSVARDEPIASTYPANGEPLSSLKGFLSRGGCIRLPNSERLHDRKYKKGYEVRLVAHSTEEMTAIVELLRASGLRAGKSYTKYAQIIIPIYGRSAVEMLAGPIGQLSRKGDTSSRHGRSGRRQHPERQDRGQNG